MIVGKRRESARFATHVRGVSPTRLAPKLRGMDAAALDPVLFRQVQHVREFVAQSCNDARRVLEGKLEKLEKERKALESGRGLAIIRPMKAICRQIAQLQGALKNLEPQLMDARVAEDVQAFVDRWTELETTERRRCVEKMEAARRQSTRYLPMVPGSGGPGGAGGMGDGKGQTAGRLVAQEMRFHFGLDTRPVDIIPFDSCPRCHVALHQNTSLQQLVCPNGSCGYWKRFADMTSAALAFGEELEFTKYSYNPVTHFEDTIKYAQAGEAFVVVTPNLEIVQRALWEDGVRPEDVTMDKIRKIIYRQNGVQGLRVENTVQIYSRLTGRAPPRLHNYAVDQLRIMFVTQLPFAKKYAKARVNNLSYPYGIYKDCELLGYWEMLESLPLLRCPHKLSEYDENRALFSKDLDWEFIPTIRPEENPAVQDILRVTKQ